MINYYEILNVNKNATLNEITKSYKKLAFQYHPDKNTDIDTTQQFQKISEAYDILKDSKKRKIYDDKINKNTNKFFNIFNDNYNFNNMIHKFFNNKNENTIYHNINLTLDEIHSGIEKKITLNLNRKCEKCNCKGYLKNGRIICNICNGNKYVLYLNTKKPCLNCNSKGFNIKKGYECTNCNMSGIIKKNIKYNIKIPKGTIIGKDIILKEKGNYIKELDLYNNLCFKLKEIKHNKYKRINNNLYIEIDISLCRALCNNNYKLNYLNNQILNINIDKILKPNYIMKINGYGMPLLHNNNILYGDLLIKFNIIFPEKLDIEKQKHIQNIFNYTINKDNTNLINIDYYKEETIFNKEKFE
jgi:DnaJ-class molecular chaperone